MKFEILIVKAQTLLKQNADQTRKITVTGYLTKSRTLVVILVLCASLVIGSLCALAMGSEHIAISQIFAAFLAKVTGSASPISREQEVILFSLRVPRIALSLGVGAALAIAGAAFQALLRNPLADPYVLGVSGGAALGSIVAIMFAAEFAVSRPLFGFAGAAAATLIVYRLGRRDGDPAHLVLAGVVMSTF
ncbi:iron ABC transporter permease, partial [candidate division KSB1 bacterium]|nr:iron ABC transporter permease [candidate division KSB1 bacterium]